jgi:hypothetical protein
MFNTLGHLPMEFQTGVHAQDVLARDRFVELGLCGDMLE